MNASEFVASIRTQVLESATEGTITNLQHPPGRRPASSLVSLSQWFNALSVIDQERVREVAALASHGAVFGFLAVLDGVRVIEVSPEKGKLELWYVKGDQTNLVNDANAPLLHDILQQR